MPDDLAIETLVAARLHTGHYVAIDSPEYLFAAAGRIEAARAWVRELRTGLRLTGLSTAVNLRNRNNRPPICPRS